MKPSRQLTLTPTPLLVQTISSSAFAFWIHARSPDATQDRVPLCDSQRSLRQIRFVPPPTRLLLLLLLQPAANNPPGELGGNREAAAELFTCRSGCTLQREGSPLRVNTEHNSNQYTNNVRVGAAKRRRKRCEEKNGEEREMEMEMEMEKVRQGAASAPQTLMSLSRCIL